jgi:hypothetical protein
MNSRNERIFSYLEHDGWLLLEKEMELVRY